MRLALIPAALLTTLVACDEHGASRLVDEKVVELPAEGATLLSFDQGEGDTVIRGEDTNTIRLVVRLSSPHL